MFPSSCRKQELLANAEVYIVRERSGKSNYENTYIHSYTYTYTGGKSSYVYTETYNPLPSPTKEGAHAYTYTSAPKGGGREGGAEKRGTASTCSRVPWQREHLVSVLIGSLKTHLAAADPTSRGRRLAGEGGGKRWVEARENQEEGDPG